ncbi:MAG: transcription termination/antitermination protein NusA [Candidatus Tectomicrobia bacterium]|nr:transcription termination/antitermination protein NusA [Candidatus Tectomicrobia bacterium]
MNHELMQIIDQIGREKGIDRETLSEAVKAAYVSAFKKGFGKSENIEATFNSVSGNIELFSRKVIVEKVSNKETEITLEDALQLTPTAQIGTEVAVPLEVKSLGRIAAQTAKQVIIQRIREAEREIIYKEYKDRQGDLINGVVLRQERGNVIIDLGKAEGILPKSEQAPKESYRRGDRLKLYILDVKKTNTGPQIVLSRTHAGLLVKLFEMEVPEIYEGIVELKRAVREPNVRAKIAVVSHNKDVDPIGALVGMRGVRVQAVAQELGGEKIDIIVWTEDPATFVCNALSPAKVLRVTVDDRSEAMEVIVPDDQLSLAIGKKGQNVRLAARLTRWKIDIKSESQQAGEKGREEPDSSLLSTPSFSLDEEEKEGPLEHWNDHEASTDLLVNSKASERQS